jgi:hypothetical protein
MTKLSKNPVRLLCPIAVGFAGFACGLQAYAAECPPAVEKCSPLVNQNDASKDCPNVHNMLVVGDQTVFLSHLPMFGGLNNGATSYTTPHRFQVILEATFTDQSNNVQDIYTRDRQAHSSTKMYTLSPECLVLSDLFRFGLQNPQRSSFNATVFRACPGTTDSRRLTFGAGILDRGGER